MKDKETLELLYDLSKRPTTELAMQLMETTVENMALDKRIKELETINEEHRKINGELRKTINEAIDYNKKVLKENWYGGYEKEIANKTINILQGE